MLFCSIAVLGSVADLQWPGSAMLIYVDLPNFDPPPTSKRRRINNTPLKIGT